MSVTSLLIPVFVQVALTFALISWMWSQRGAAIKSGQVKYSDVSLREPMWPKRATQIGTCFQNQLETPILFYVVIAPALITRMTGVVFVTLAWTFVASRLLHAYIHTGTDNVKMRFYAMLVGVIILGAIWVIFAARILIVVL
ncbi:MAG: MAPEG family protein [Hyphomicrobium sp.]